MNFGDVVMALRAREKKKIDREGRPKLRETKPSWLKVFIGKTFRDPELGDGELVFTELRQWRTLARDRSSWCSVAAVERQRNFRRALGPEVVAKSRTAAKRIRF